MNTTTYTEGQKVWVRMSWQDDDCWVWGEVVKQNPKTIRVDTDGIRPIGNYSIKNVKPRD